jgi:hypothetical protein
LNVFQVSIFVTLCQLLLFCGSSYVIHSCASQDYIRYLEKEEEEQKRIQKVLFSCLLWI